MMRQGSNSGRRPRGRTNRNKQHGGGQSRTHTFDSNGPDGRVRGNARQVYEKYLTLARDASSAGDRITAEAYYQHAEHYFRILSDSTDPQPANRRQEERPAQSHADESPSYENEDATAGGNDGAAGAVEEASESRGNGAAGKDAGAPEVNGQDAEGEAQPRPRRGRPRKPRTQDGGQPAKTEAASETEEGPAAG